MTIEAQRPASLENEIRLKPRLTAASGYTSLEILLGLANAHNKFPISGITPICENRDGTGHYSIHAYPPNRRGAVHHRFTVDIHDVSELKKGLASRRLSQDITIPV